MNFPNELVNIVMSYMSSPTAALIKDFAEEVKNNMIEDGFEEYDADKDFHFAVWGSAESSMVRRNCICDEGIYREGVYQGGWY